MQNQSDLLEVTATRNKIEKHFSEVHECCNSAALKYTAPNVFLASTDSAELKLGVCVLVEHGVEHQTPPYPLL